MLMRQRRAIRLHHSVRRVYSTLITVPPKHTHALPLGERGGVNINGSLD
jgi:hypothetical protein